MVRQLDSDILQLVADVDTEIESALEFSLTTAKVLRKAESFLTASLVQTNKTETT